MKKFFTFVAAALLSAGLFAEPIQEDLTLDAEAWWGWSSSHENVEGKLVGNITGQWGAIGTSLEADWTEWDKLVIVVDNIDGCEGEWWFVKAELRDPSFDPTSSENIVMSGELGKDGHVPTETNYVVIDLNAVPAGFDITKVSAMIIQSQALGSFTVSRIFLEKEEETQAIHNTAANVNAVKVVRNGQIFILKNGKTFNALGAEVK